MANRTLRTQRIAKPAVRLSSGDLFLTRQGADTEDAVALMSDLAAYMAPHPRYHFHGYAGDQISGDGKFFDLSPLGNHAVRGANLSEAQMLANAGYISTLNPSAGAADSVLRIPNLNFDYAGGEKFILYWLGKITPEGGASAEWLGDGYDTSHRGINLRCTAAGMLMFVLCGNTLGYTNDSTVAPFDGTLHSFAITIDGAAKRYTMWIDEVLNRDLSLGATAYDTRNSVTFNIGSVIAAPGSSTEAYGAASQTRALHILRLSATDAMPNNATLTNTFKQLRVNPSKPILGGTF